MRPKGDTPEHGRDKKASDTPPDLRPNDGVLILHIWDSPGLLNSVAETARQQKHDTGRGRRKGRVERRPAMSQPSWTRRPDENRNDCERSK